ncbi:hypothetical protein [Caminibacter pacificus]
MHFYELKIKTNLKAPIHFRKSPEALSKLIATALINSGYTEHNEKKPKNYVFSNMGRADEKGIYQGDKVFYFRTFKEDLAQKIAKSLFLYEDNIFKIKGVDFKVVPQKHIKEIFTQNQVFVVMKENGLFWTFEKSGDITTLLSALQDNLIRKYETTFNKKIKPENNFIEYLQIKNQKPQTFIYKGAKFFGYKLEIKPRDDEASQKLAFTALATGLGHKNSSVGGGFCVYKTLS